MQRYIIALLILSSVLSTHAWWAKNGKGKRNCFCLAVDAFQNGKVLYDFGSIGECEGFPTCPCRRSTMIDCGTNCDKRVKEWLQRKPWQCRGRQVKAHYIASTCHKGYGHEMRRC